MYACPLILVMFGQFDQWEVLIRDWLEGRSWGLSTLVFLFLCQVPERFINLKQICSSCYPPLTILVNGFMSLVIIFYIPWQITVGFSYK